MTKPRKWSVYTSTYIITDEEKFSAFMDRIKAMEAEGCTYETGEVWMELFSTFPLQSRNVRIGHKVMVFDKEWKEAEVTEDNLKEIRIKCGIGIVTHQHLKLDLPEAATVAA